MLPKETFLFHPRGERGAEGGLSKTRRRGLGGDHNLQAQSTDMVDVVRTSSTLCKSVAVRTMQLRCVGEGREEGKCLLSLLKTQRPTNQPTHPPGCNNL